jgi:hypothetical protein
MAASYITGRLSPVVHYPCIPVAVALLIGTMHRNSEHVCTESLSAKSLECLVARQADPTRKP